MSFIDAGESENCKSSKKIPMATTLKLPVFSLSPRYPNYTNIHVQEVVAMSKKKYFQILCCIVVTLLKICFQICAIFPCEASKIILNVKLLFPHEMCFGLTKAVLGGQIVDES